MDEILEDNPVKDFPHFISFELIIINQIPQDTDACIIFWLNPQVTHFIMTLCWRNHSWEDVIVTVVSQNIFYVISHYNKSKLKRRWRPSWTRNHFKRAPLRDRPFNLKGGGYGFLFRSEFFFQITQELEYLFFLSRKAQIFFQNLTLGYIRKTLNQIFFPSTKIRIFFSATLGIKIFF